MARPLATGPERQAALKTLKWITAGFLGGALYAWLVSLMLARSLALAWPEWYGPLFADQLRLGLFIWDMLIIWLPCLLIAMLIGLVFRKLIRQSATSAALLGAGGLLLFVIVDPVAAGSPAFIPDLTTFVVSGLLPLGVFLVQLRSKSFSADSGSASTA